MQRLVLTLAYIPAHFYVCGLVVFMVVTAYLSTSYHLGCAVSLSATIRSRLTLQAIGTRVLRATTNLMDGLDNVKMTVSLDIPILADPQREMYFKTIVPIGILFSGSLILSNTAYLT